MKRLRAKASAEHTAIGCRVHSGWTAMVVVGGSAKAPVVFDRRRIINADRSIPGSKQPYHYVETWPLPKAQEYLSRCMRRTQQMTRDELAAVVKETKAKGLVVIGCGILTSSGRPVPSLEQALSSHAMLHTAEGEFYRNALAEASEHCDVAVTRLREKELFAHAQGILGVPPESLTKRLGELGRTLGPPWSQDEKLAALTAWIVLVSNKK